MDTDRYVLSLAADIGEAMLANGAEIYRVEDTISHILDKFLMSDHYVYVISNAVFVSSADRIATLRQVPLSPVNLERIAMLNQLARDLCSGECSLAEGRQQLRQITSFVLYRNAILILAGGLAAAAFCRLLGGTLADSVFAFPVGMLEEWFLLICSKKHVSPILKNIFASILVTMVSNFLAYTSLPVYSDPLIIGAIMLLVPGIGITTAIRDYLNGEYLSGTIHLISAFLTGFCIVAGVLSGNWLWQVIREILK